jgi:hypothetical protein
MTVEVGYHGDPGQRVYLRFEVGRTVGLTELDDDTYHGGLVTRFEIPRGGKQLKLQLEVKDANGFRQLTSADHVAIAV